jgi:hypothetical protein
MLMRWPAFWLAPLLLPCVLVHGKAWSEAPIDFSRQIRPILAEKCFRCHGPDEKARKADLRLDVRDQALADRGEGIRAIVPGKPDDSEMIARIEEEPAFAMPPVKSGKTLSAQEKQLLRQWIAQGAKYEQHWAYLPPRRAIPPQVKQGGWARTPLDRFILAKLEARGLTPSPEAERAALLRRVSLDLTGLPPSLEDLNRFLHDHSPDAYEKAVDRLLASTAYGERWGRIWLDLARYADSAGYAQDPPRTIWRYRDWVIQAINGNQPFDQFTIEQLAGDLLPHPSNEQLIATAFHRNTMTNSEGGTNDEEFRNAAVVDRVNTTMEVWMGMTMGCARCHSHKYDPITQEEYFRFFAIFNNTEDADRGDESPNLYTLTPEQQEEKARLQQEITRLEGELAKQAPAPKTALSTSSGPLPTRYVRIELEGKGVFLSLAEVQVFAGEKNLAVKGKARQVSTDFDGPAQLAIDGNTNGDYFAAKSTTHTARQDNPWWEVDLGQAQVIDRIVVWNRTDGGTGKRLAPYRVVALNETRQPLWVGSSSKPPTPQAEWKLPATAEELDKQARSELVAYRNGAGKNSGNPLARKLAQVKKQLANLKGVPTPIMRELPAGGRRKTHIQIRGNYLVTGKEVTPGVPAAFQPLPAGVEPNRLVLARWLVDDNNPLTARVLANRYWEHLFGEGLVVTSEDFGVQGEPPTHPELLDWLATELMRMDWDTKRFVRLLVTSATYRQTSRVTPDLLEQDPHNHLLSRGPRFRQSAEAIRDQALFVSGLLSRKMYGPSVRPPQPKLGLRAAFGGSTDWQPSPGQDRYRRGLYTSWRRTTPYPSMVTFDAPSREVCTIRRIRTNTPLQALVTLNDPVYVEAAQALARRMVLEGGKTPEERLTLGFRLCLSRPPTERERARLLELHARARARYTTEPEMARQLASDPLGPVPEGMETADLAAWTLVGNVLMNLDEFLARR